jgi:predicted RNase H-like HicB family nuclease
MASRSQAVVEHSFVVPIETFAPEPFEVLRPLCVVVQPQDGGYIASLFDANINASGETAQDAVANLKDLMLALYVRLQKEPKERLGKGPARQRAVLQALLRRKRRYAPA